MNVPPCGKTNFPELSNRRMEIKYVDIHTHSTGNTEGIIALPSYSVGMDAAPPASDFFSAGVHPWSAGKTDMASAVEYLLTAPLAAIGETGLDYAVDGFDKYVQVSVFKVQLDIAEKRGLPVVIHCVKAYNDVLGILQNYRLKAVIFHCYIGSQQQTASLTSRGYYISAGEASLNSPKTAESLKQCPGRVLFAETDTSPVAIEDIYTRLADIRRTTAGNMKDIIYGNYKRIFG